MSKRRVFATAMLVVLLAVGSCAYLLDKQWPIDGYRLVDEDTIVVTAASGWLDWTRVTSVEERADSVVIGMRSLRFNGLRTSDGASTDYIVQLKSPLSARVVIDATTGEPPRQHLDGER